MDHVTGDHDGRVRDVYQSGGDSGECCHDDAFARGGPVFDEGDGLWGAARAPQQ